MKEHSLTTKIFNQLQAKIRSNELAPGTRLKVSAWAQQLDVSRGVVRAALVRLVGENLVVLKDKAQFFVSPVNVENVLETSELRKILERGSLCLAFQMADQAWIDGLDGICSDFSGAVQAGHFDQAARLDLSFHQALVAGANNSRLKQLYGSCNIEALHQNAIGFLTGIDDYRRIDSEHRSILIALRNRNIEEAEMLLLKHLDGTSELVVQYDKLDS